MDIFVEGISQRVHPRYNIGSRAPREPELITIDVVVLCHLQLAELRTERSRLTQRLQTAEKTSKQQQQQLQRQLHSAEQNVQLRERDLMLVHQQYQMLYQQYALLQQQSASRTVRLCNIYIRVN